MEQKLIQFIKKPSVSQSLYVASCMIISFGFGILAEYSLLNKGNDPVVTLPKQPVPLAMRYKTPKQANAYDAIPAVISVQPSPEKESAGTAQASTGKNFVASKTGTKYYPSDCGSVSRIKEENRVYFGTEDEAKDKGYERTTACK